MEFLYTTTTLLVLLSASWLMSGVINPRAVYPKSLNRLRIFCYGFLAFIAAVLFMPSLPPNYQTTSLTNGVLIIGFIACALWPWYALVTLVISCFKTKKINNKKSPNKTIADTKINEIPTGNINEVVISYIDSKGEFSKRSIDFKYGDGPTRFHAFCHDRHAIRTFRYDRIVDITTRSGIKINLDDWVTRRSGREVPANYPIKKPARKIPNQADMVVLFTGFKKPERESLEHEAIIYGLTVSKSRRVTKSIDWVVSGPTAGPKKLEDAARLGIPVLDSEAFLDMLDTGEINILSIIG